jgi:hypothetical protein
LHHLYGGEHAYLLERYIEALDAAGFAPVQVLSPLRSSINLFPHTLESLREGVVVKLSQKLSAGPLWRTMLKSNAIFKAMLSVAERFDNRPGRLYSFVAHKAPA